MLSERISSWRVCSVHASVPDAYTQCTHQFLTHVLSMFRRDLFKFGIFRLILSICVCSGYASVPDKYAQQTHQFLLGMLRVRISMLSMFWRDLLKLSYVCSVHAPYMLIICISSWHACWVHAKVPYASAEGMQYDYLNNGKTYVHAEHVHKEPMHIVRVLVSSWSAQWMYQFLMHMLNIFWRDLFKFVIFTLMLSIWVRNWCVC